MVSETHLRAGRVQQGADRALCPCQTGAGSIRHQSAQSDPQGAEAQPLNAIEQQQILAIIKALITPALVFAIVATFAFGFSIIKPEQILPAEVVGAQGSEEAILYSPEVLKKADSMGPNRLFAAGKLDQAMTKAYALAASKPYDVIANMAAGNVLVQSETEDVSQEGYRLLKRSVSLAPRSRYVRSNLAENLAKQKK